MRLHDSAGRSSLGTSPLTPIQSGILYDCVAYTGNAGAYVVSSAYRVTGSWDTDALYEAWSALTSERSCLRSSVGWRDRAEPEQLVHTDVLPNFIFDDISDLPIREHDAWISDLLKSERTTGFDLESAPLVRLRGVRTSRTSGYLIWTGHHIVVDGWSKNIILQELLHAYANILDTGEPALEPELVSPRKYQDWLAGRDREKERRYWKAALESAEITPLTSDRLETTIDRDNFRSHGFKLDLESLRQVSALGQRTRVTVPAIANAAWALLLKRWTNSGMPTFGTVFSGRSEQLPELVSATGMFVNTVPCSFSVDESLSVKDYLKSIYKQYLKLQSYSYLTISEMKDALAVPIPEIDQLFVVENQPGELSASLSRSGESIKAEHISTQERTTYPLVVSFVIASDIVQVNVTYNDSTYTGELIERLMRQFKGILESFCEDTDRRLNTLNILDKQDLHKVAELQDGLESNLGEDVCLHELFEAHVAATPDAVAVMAEDGSLTYSELNAQANQLARTLRDAGVVADSLVGIGLKRSSKMVVAVLGVLKSGGAYVPLDPSYPEDRLRHMMSDASLAAVVTDSSLGRDLLNETSCPVIEVGSDLSVQNSSENLTKVGNPTDLAYVIYTSGSSGVPKGVMIEHQSVVNYIEWARRTYGIPQGSGSLLHSPLSFDLTVTSLFVPLTTGKFVRLLGSDSQTDDISTECPTGGLLKITPAHLSVLAEVELDEGSDHVGIAVVGGDALTRPMLEQWFEQFPESAVVNEYGPTESTVGCCVREVTRHQIADLDASVPIGRPIENTSLYVLDADMHVVPFGAVGELYIGGRGLARGYLNRPELTREKFVPNPHGVGRLYRSGDLVRYLENGELVYLGRTDNQVKVRGYRIELGEVETALSMAPGVKQAVVLTEPDPLSTGNRLVAYLVRGERQLNPNQDEIRDYLSKRLPRHMIPSILTEVNDIPLTPNGKIDRNKLVSTASSARSRELLPPCGLIEEKLHRIWMQALDIESISIEDDFFQLGGHSLLAMRLISKMRSEFLLSISLKTMFDRPTIKLMAEYIVAADESVTPRISKQGRTESPLSHGQQEIWLLRRLSGSSHTYHVPEVWHMSGSVNVDALEGAIRDVVSRHEILRTIVQDGPDGPIQKIQNLSHIQIKLEVETVLTSAKMSSPEFLTEYVKPFVERPFESSQSMMRTVLFKDGLGENDWLLVLCMHHLVFDGSSSEILRREISQFYQQHLGLSVEKVSALPVQYADFVHWQTHEIESGNLHPQVSYWVKQLAGVPRLALPYDDPEAGRSADSGSTVSVTLSAEVIARLKEVQTSENASMFMLLLTAFQIALAKWTGQKEIAVGVPASGRDKQELEDIIGFLLNMIVVRGDVDPRNSVLGHIQKVREATLDGFAHAEAPLSLVASEIGEHEDFGRERLFNTAFFFEYEQSTSIPLPGVVAKPVKYSLATSKWDLDLTTIQRSDEIECLFTYSTELFEKETIERFADLFLNCVLKFSKDKNVGIAEASRLPDDQLRRVLDDFNDTYTPYEDHIGVAELVTRQAQRGPLRNAVTAGTQKLTYQDLEFRAGNLSEHLRSLGVSNGSRVAILLSRNVDIVVAILGVLKAGATFIPVDPSYPTDRVLYMFKDSDSQATIGDDISLERIDPDTGITVNIRVADVATESRDSVEIANAPEDGAYIIYTSGSSGKPKGVMVRNRSLSNRIQAMAEVYEVEPTDTILQFASISFDAALEQIFTTLISGASLVMRNEDVWSPSDIAHAIKQNGVTVAELTPTVWEQLIPLLEGGAALGTSLRLLILGGEAVRAAPLEDWFSSTAVPIINTYGPTEVTISSTSHLIKEPVSRVPIGRPLPNTRAYIVDQTLDLVPIGSVGELLLGGPCVAVGYLNRPELTEEKFISDSFSKVGGERLYRTGDLARWRSDGTIDFLGRIDDQIKLHGLRIELGEIEHSVDSHPKVNVSAAIISASGTHTKFITCYCVLRAGESATEIELREWCGTTLPHYMVPSRFVFLKDLPQLPNGKLNKAVLPEAVPEEHVDATVVVPARNPIEKIVAEEFERVLGVSPVSVDANFFHLGGHSLAAMQLINRLEAATQLKLELRKIFDSPTAENVALHVLDVFGNQEITSSSKGN